MTDPTTPRHPVPRTALAELAEYQKTQNEAVTKNLNMWRTGVAAILTLAVGGITISARGAIDTFPEPWRAAVAGLVLAGTLLGVISLLVALRSEVGDQYTVTPAEQIIEEGGLLAHETRRAVRLSGRLRHSQIVASFAVAALFAALACFWLAPTNPTLSRVEVTTGGKTVCGKLLSADNRQIRIEVAGESNPRAIPFPAVANIRLTANCR